MKSLKSHKLNENLISPSQQHTSAIQQSAIKAGEPDQGEGIHIPEHVHLDQDRFLQELELLSKSAAEKDDTLRTKMINAIKEVRNAVMNNEMQEGHLKRGKKTKPSNICKTNIVMGKRSTKDVDLSLASEHLTKKKCVDTSDEQLQNDEDVNDRGMMVGKPTRKLIKGDVVSTDPTRYDGDIPGSYSSEHPDRVVGRIVSNKQNKGMFRVRWDSDNSIEDTHWSHLVLEIPKISVETMLAILGDATELKSRPFDQTGKWPANFFEALVRSDWRDWVMAVKKENSGWIINQATSVVKYKDMKSGTRCIPLGELFSVKRDGKYKFRQIAFGNMLRPGKDYGETFASTVSADGMRWFFALACSTNLQIYGWDATVGYLQADLEIPVYAYLPSHHEYSELPMEELAVLRTRLLTLIQNEGVDGLKRFVTEHRRSTRRDPESVL